MTNNPAFINMVNENIHIIGYVILFLAIISLFFLIRILKDAVPVNLKKFEENKK